MVTMYMNRARAGENDGTHALQQPPGGHRGTHLNLTEVLPPTVGSLNALQLRDSLGALGLHPRV